MLAEDKKLAKSNPDDDKEAFALRKNCALSAKYTEDALRHPFAQGTFRWVAKGVYTAGSREGQECVGKWFKDGLAINIMDNAFYEQDIRAVKQAGEIIKLFNNSRTIDKDIRLNIPEIWRFEKNAPGGRRAGSIFLCEPFVRYFQRFNSNTVSSVQSSGTDALDVTEETFKTINLLFCDA